MVAGQLGKLLGVQVDGTEPIAQIVSAVQHLDATNGPTLAISLAVIVTLFVGTRFAPRLPWPLLAVLGATVLTTALGLEEQGVKVVGSIPQGLPRSQLPTDLSLLPQILGPAVGIAVVAFADNALDGRAFADDGEEIDADAELIVLGMSNVGASLTSGFPVSSSSSRTALAKVSGARTPAYGWVTAAAVVLVLLFAGPHPGGLPDGGPGGPRGLRRLQDRGHRGVPVALELPQERVLARHRHRRRRAHAEPAGRHRVRDRAVRRGRAGTGGTAACGSPGPGPRPGRHARHR